MEVAIPSPIRVRCNPGSSIKFCPTVAEIAEISPICSIMVAMAIGAMIRIAVRLNFGRINGGSPTTAAEETPEKFKITDPSGFVKPSPCRTSANTYEITTPRRIGIILNIPFPQILKIMITASATIAMSQFVDALLTADGARLSPIQIMIGPVTTGGRKRITRFTPTHRMISARIRYNNPATTIPPHAYCSFSLSAILANIPVSSAATLEKPPRKANEDPRKAGTLNLVHRWKNKVPNPAQNNVTCTDNTCEVL